MWSEGLTLISLKPSPLTNLWGVPAGTTAIWPALSPRVSPSIVKVALPASTMKVSS
jgi:hypothetical protein